MTLLTAKEAAQRLRIGLSTAYDLARRGDIPSVRLGRSVRIPEAALEGWIERWSGCWRERRERV